MLSATGLYYEWHGPENGRVVILSPGMGGSGSYWAPNLAALSATYRVLVYDHRGTGRSDLSLPDDVTIKSMARDVSELIEELGITSPSFIGHALGGLIGLALDLSYNRLCKLVIVNGWGAPDPHFERCFDIRLELLRKSGPSAYVRAQPVFLYPANWISKNIDLLNVEAEHQIAHFQPIENLEKRVAAARAFEIWLDLTTKVLVIAAADDMLVPSNASKELAANLVGAEYIEMKWGGHACNVTDPDTFNHLVLDFLGS